MVDNEQFNPQIWGPYFWFFIQTIALQYPNNPNDVIKKKYFTLFTDMEHFLPGEDSRKTYSGMLNDYPISPYLDSKISLLKWVNFIHNKYNRMLNKPIIEMHKGLEDYYKLYDNDISKEIKNKKMREYIVYVSIVSFLILVCIYLYYVNIYEI